MSSSSKPLCPPRYRDGDWFRCGLVVLERDPSGPEACPSYGGGGMFICGDCIKVVRDFMKRAHDARAVRMEHREEEDYFEPLP